MQPTQLQYLKEIGIDVWVDRQTPPMGASVADAAEQQAVVAETVEFESLRQQVSGCTACALHETRTQTVFGVGNPNADWLIIGEAPGADEDRQGEPFVGRAGKLLNAMLLALGFKREQVFIANILKCRPPNNRDPKPEEVQACEHFLKSQIAMIQPKMILCVGRVAAQNLLKVDTPIGKLRGQTYHYADTSIPVIVTYHPAYLLRSPREKRKVWDDLKMAMQTFREQS